MTFALATSRVVTRLPVSLARHARKGTRAVTTASSADRQVREPVKPVFLPTQTCPCSATARSIERAPKHTKLASREHRLYARVSPRTSLHEADAPGMFPTKTKREASWRRFSRNALCFSFFSLGNGILFLFANRVIPAATATRATRATAFCRSATIAALGRAAGFDSPAPRGRPRRVDGKHVLPERRDVAVVGRGLRNAARDERCVCISQIQAHCDCLYSHVLDICLLTSS